MKLEDIRNELDQLDQELVHLFEKRRNLSRQVALYKLGVHKPILDEAREKEKIAAVRAMAENSEEADAVEALFNYLLNDSKNLQKEIMEMHQA